MVSAMTDKEFFHYIYMYNLLWIVFEKKYYLDLNSMNRMKMACSLFSISDHQCNVCK